jgi:hypothetical protein
MKMAVFWDVMPYSMVDIALMTDVVISSEMLVCVCQTKQSNIPENSHLLLYFLFI